MRLLLNDTFRFCHNQRVIMALGTFDGMHLGHQALINKVSNLSRLYNYSSMVYTFLNHPLDIIDKKQKPPLLMTKNEKILAFQEFNLDYLAMVPFTRNFSVMTYQDFIQRLVNQIPFVHLIVGYNFTFGYKGLGNVEHLRDMGKRMGYHVHVIPPIMVDGDVVSSTKIRNLIQMGHMEKANQLLGRPYSITGIVTHGKKIGRTLGFPTANISSASEKVIPNPGVYVTTVKLKKQWFNAVTNIGYNPTIGENQNITIETHVLDFNKDIYGSPMRIYFLEKIRSESKFSSQKALVDQMNNDLQYAFNYFKNHKTIASLTGS